MHDVGKLAIIDTIFIYGRDITDEEFRLIRLHPEAGYHLAKKGTSLEKYRDLILYHHKSYDGTSGYPVDKNANDSPDKILIDITTVSDCMDAATDMVGRSYAKGKTLDEFLEEIRKGSGKWYCPEVVALFDDPKVYEDIKFLLSEGRERIYSDTYYLLKNVQQHVENRGTDNDPVEAFREFLAQKNKYTTSIELINYDIETQAPEKGLDDKADALAMISLKQKEYVTSAETEQLFKRLSKADVQDEALNKSYELLKEEFDRQRRIPNDFYEEFVKEKAISGKAWERAKKNNDFSIFEPYLEKMITMTRKQCEYTDPDKDVYDVLIDEFEKGMDKASIDPVFAEMKTGLNNLIRRIEEKPAFDTSVLKGTYGIEGQKAASKLLLDYIGFDMSAGVLSESVHPFTTRISYGDTRLTNSYRLDDAINSMFSAIHEGGHALFEQGIDVKYRNTEIEHVQLMGLHESISRFYENILGRNKAFWIPVYPKVKELLPKYRDVDLDTFYRAINDVKRSFIRIDADEVTYGLHIILRYEMEKAIFEEHVPVSRLPELWNDKSEEILGIRPSTDSEGILQDMHWSDGGFGYFPSYLLGSIYDGMLLNTIEEELGSVDDILEKGEILKITEWFKENIFRHGCMYTSKELITRICKKDITAKDLLGFFNKKYGEIYGI